MWLLLQMTGLLLLEQAAWTKADADTLVANRSVTLHYIALYATSCPRMCLSNVHPSVCLSIWARNSKTKNIERQKLA